MASGYPDFEGQKSKLYPVADWAAIEATDKNFYGSAVNIGYGVVNTTTYNVPAGKTLYITGMAGRHFASVAANADLNQIAQIYIYNLPTLLAQIGGNGGEFMSFAKPLVFNGGDTMTLNVYGAANHNMNVGVTAWGFEV